MMRWLERHPLALLATIALLCAALFIPDLLFP